MRRRLDSRVTVLVLVVVAAVAAGTGTAGAQVGEGGWPSRHGGPEADKQAPGALPQDGAAVRWVLDDAALGLRFTGTSGRGMVLGPAGELVVVGTDPGPTDSASDDTGVAVGLDPADGAEVWRAEGIDALCPPALAPDGRIWLSRVGGEPARASSVPFDPATGAFDDTNAPSTTRSRDR